MPSDDWRHIAYILAGLVQLLGGGIIRYLLKQIDIRDKVIEKSNESAIKTNELNQQLAALYVDEQRVRAMEGKKSP